MTAAVTVEQVADIPGRQRTGPDVQLRLGRHAHTVGQVRRALDAVLTALHVTAECRERIAVAVSEACANAVEHAHGTDEYHVTARVGEDRCEVTITDHGCGFRPPSPDVPPPPGAENGRGLHLIAALADHFELHTRPGKGTRVRVAMNLAFAS